MPHVIILSAPSGAGKSTFCRLHKEAAVVSADHHMVDSEGNYTFDPSRLGECHDLCLKGFIAALQAGVEKIIVDNTNTTMMEVSPYYRLAEVFGYTVEIVFLRHPSAEVMAQRNLHGVPLKGIERMIQNIKKLRGEIPPWWNTNTI